MEQFDALLQDLYNRIPRRHTTENLVTIKGILDEYSTVLGKIELINAWYEQQTAALYPSLETIQSNIKLSASNKYAKKAKDDLFDTASGQLKDDIEKLIAVYANGKKE